MVERDGWLRMAGAFEGWQLTPWRFALEEQTRTVVLSDLHLGAEISLARQGMYLPDVSTRPMVRAWEQVVATAPKRVVIAGDLFDAPTVDAGAARLFGELLHMLPAHCEVLLTPGNHDPEESWLREMFSRVRIEAGVRIQGQGGEMTVTHGHKMPSDAGQSVIVGHQHPAVRLATRVQSAKMACFAECRIGRSNVLILPAFSLLPLGSNLMTGRHWILDIPAPRQEQVRVYGIVKEQVLDFGDLAALGG